MRTLCLAVLLTFSALLLGCSVHYPWVVIEQAEPNPFIGKNRFYVKSMQYEELRIGSKSEDEYVADKEDDSVASFDGDKDAVAERFHNSLVKSARQRGVKVKKKSGKKKSAGLSARELLLGNLPAREAPRSFLLVADEKGPPAEAEAPGAKREVAPPRDQPTADEEFDEGEEDAVAEGPFVIKPNIDFMEPGYYAWIAKSPSTITVNIQISDSAGRLLDEIEITQSWSASVIDAASGTRYRKLADVLGRVTAEYLSHRTAPPEE